MANAFLNIGSNQGDRLAIIQQAVALLHSAFPECCVRMSEPVESEPWGYDSENMYINVGVVLEGIETMPQVLLAVAQAVERVISDKPHRNPDGTYRDRMVDIDIIAIDDTVIDTPTLTIPHPRAHLRPFVMEPLRQLSPDVAEFVERQAAKKPVGE